MGSIRGGRKPRALALVAVLTLALLMVGGGARAQTPTPPPESPSPSPEPSPEPSFEPPPSDPAPSPQPTSTPSNPGPQGATAGGTGDGSFDAARGGDDKLTAGRGDSPGTGGGPRRGRRRHRQEESCIGALPQAGSSMDLGGPRSTDSLIGILQPLVRDGASLREALLALGGPLPVAGLSQWANDWHAIRCEPTPHLHEGIDIFAPHGTPVVAVADGRLSQRTAGEISGLAVELVDDQGTQYFYAHLSAFAEGIRTGMQVAQGRVLGYVGATGNARGGSAHLHLEVQPGGVPVPPKPYVDRWLATAEERARRLVDRARETGLAFSGPSPAGAGAVWMEALPLPGSWASTHSHPGGDWPLGMRLVGAGAPWAFALLTLLALRPRRRQRLLSR
jgi:hypothetical protein